MGQITEELARLCGLRTSVFEPERFTGELAAAQGDGVPAAWIFRRGVLTGGPKAPPLELQVRSGAMEPDNAGVFAPSVAREQALREILPLLNQGLADGEAPAVISTTGKLSRELYELDDREHDKGNRFYMVGSMGCAAGFGLGVARGRPSGKVIVLDGDGAVLMKMGTLATIGRLGPENFHHVVFDNGSYESTGAQPTSSPGVDLAAVAVACGYTCGSTVDEAEGFRQALERQLQRPGPSLLRMVIKTGSREDLGRPKLKPRDGWLRFCSYLQGREGQG
jgi:phosphonopyruvate decarboxylase